MATLLAWPSGEGLEAQPYQRLLYGELRRRGWRVESFTPGRLLTRPPELVHIHWPDLVLLEPRAPLRFLKTAAFLALFALARLRGRQLVWTVHNPNLRPEQRSPWGRAYVRLLAALCSGLVFLSPSHREARQSWARGKPVALIPLPHFRTIYGERRERGAAKQRLGLEADQPVAGFFGKVRPYKGLPVLASAFRELEDPRLGLLVAGEFDASCEQLLPGLRSDSRTVLLDRHLPVDEVAWVIAAMDVVVLPYLELGNSAVAMLALSYDRPVLAPAGAPAMVELREAVGADWVRLYSGELTPGQLEEGLRRPTPRGRPDLAAFDPEQEGELTDRFFRRLLTA